MEFFLSVYDILSTMQKDFDNWNERKKKINNRRNNFPKKREVWWADMGANIGHEQDGVGKLYERPVLVLKKFANCTCLVAPLTKANYKDRYHFDLEPFGYRSRVLVSQIRTISMRRLTRDIERLDKSTFDIVLKQIERINSFCKCDNNEAPLTAEAVRGSIPV